MNLRSLAGPFAVVLPLFGVTGCGLFSDNGTGLAQVDDLVSWVERVHVETEVSKERVRNAVSLLETLVADNRDADAVTTYAELVAAVERSEGQAERLRSRFDSMEDAAEPVFQQWADDLDSFSNSRIRERSQVRLQDTRDRYEAVVAAVGPALSTYDTLNFGLRDISLFLGHDFNPASVSEIAADVGDIVELSRELDDKLDSCLEVARVYVESAALPVRVELSRPGEGDGGRDGDRNRGRERGPDDGWSDDRK